MNIRLELFCRGCNIHYMIFHIAGQHFQVQLFHTLGQFVHGLNQANHTRLFHLVIIVNVCSREKIRLIKRNL